MYKIKYRYRLDRVLDPNNPREVCWVMINPSTADDTKDDATIQSIKRISESNGYGMLTVCNIFAIRATEPKDLRWLMIQGVDLWGGPQMIAYRKALFTYATDIVVAWGNTLGPGPHSWAGFEPADTLKQIAEFTEHPLCCGKNKNGSPKHPLYLKADTKLVPY